MPFLCHRSYFEDRHSVRGSLVQGIFRNFGNMADGGKRFCLNPPPHEGIWKWFYQAAEDIEWHAVGLTHVEYPTGNCS